MMIFSGAIVEWQDLDIETEGEVEEIFKHREMGSAGCSSPEMRSECKSGPRAHVTSM